MRRTIDIENELDRLNPWVRRSIALFNVPGYLDQIGEVYTYAVGSPHRLDDDVRRAIRQAHTRRQHIELLRLLIIQEKFPYEEPFWYLLKNVEGFITNNPNQLARIIDTIYKMTAEETLSRIEGPPKLNTQTGPMFTTWLRGKFKALGLNQFEEANEGISVLDSTEKEGERFVQDVLHQHIDKRPDLIAKAGRTYIIGEAKWVGSPGGNQNNHVVEVIGFCEQQRGNTRRVGIIDGYPWATRLPNGRPTHDKICVLTQESTCDILSALLLEDYLSSLL